MFCQMCGAGLPDNAAFCAQCGARRPQAPGEPAPQQQDLPPPSQPAVYGGAPAYGPPQQGYGAAGYGQPGYAPPQSGGAGQWGTPYDASLEGGPRYFYGGFWPRFGAYLLDTIFTILLAIVPMALLAFVLFQAVEEDATFLSLEEQQQQQEDEDAALGFGILLGFYPIAYGYNLIATSMGGGFGKRIVGLRIVSERDGSDPGWGKAFGRETARVVIAFVPFVSLLDYLWCIWDEKKQTWHDKVAGTIVIEK